MKLIYNPITAYIITFVLLFFYTYISKGISIALDVISGTILFSIPLSIVTFFIIGLIDTIIEFKS